MNFDAADKLNSISTTAKEYIAKIDEIKEKYVTKINGYITDLENVINNAATKSQKWLEMQIKKITKKIQDTIDALTKKLDTIFVQLENWYNDSVLAIKVNTVTSVLAKLGLGLPLKGAEQLADAIPSPPIVKPEINLEISIPEVSQLVNMGTVSLPRLTI